MTHSCIFRIIEKNDIYTILRIRLELQFYMKVIDFMMHKNKRLFTSSLRSSCISFQLPYYLRLEPSVFASAIALVHDS
jgi:hypothetical protein